MKTLIEMDDSGNWKLQIIPEEEIEKKILSILKTGIPVKVETIFTGNELIIKHGEIVEIKKGTINNDNSI